MVVISPDLYGKMSEDQSYLKKVRKNPIHNYLAHMDEKLPQILQHPELSDHEKMRRYTKIMQKLNSLTASHYNVPTDDAPIDAHPAEPDKVEQKKLIEPEPEPDTIEQDVPRQDFQQRIQQEFSARNQTRAETIINAVRDTPGIIIDPKTLSMEVDGVKVGTGNLFDFTHMLLVPGIKKISLTKGMQIMLAKLAKDSSLSTHAILNTPLRLYMNQQRDLIEIRKAPPNQDFAIPRQWITSSNITAGRQLQSS